MRHDFLKNSFFPSTVTEWNKIDKNIRKSESLNIFKKSILKFIRPSQNRVYNCHNPKGIKLLTRLKVVYLREPKFKHSFQDTLNPIWNCSEGIETTSHYLLHCPDYERKTLLNAVSCIVPNIFDFNNDQLTEIFLYSKDLDNINNTSILDAPINYLIETKRFNSELFWSSPDIMALILTLHLKFRFLFFFSLFLFLSFYYFRVFYILYVFFCSQVYHNIYMYTWWLFFFFCLMCRY